MSNILVLGARSDIGLSIAHRYAKEGWSVTLAARHAQTLESDATDLRVRYQTQVDTREFDVTDPDPARFFDALGALPDTIVCVVGLLGKQEASEADHAAATDVMMVNYVGPARFLNEAATRMEARGQGCIIGISSVAGDRGRASNYIYGSAKAGFTALLSGLRNRLARKGVSVITIKPGFVNTRMTAGMKLPPLLTASPDEVAEAVFKAQKSQRSVVYTRPIWLPVMAGIRMIPESIFKKLSI